MTRRTRGLIGLAVIGCGGCFEIAYVLPALRGQLHIVNNAEDIDTVLARGQLTADQLDKLELMRDAREFARRRMGLYTRDQFDMFYDAGDDPVAYNLSAAPDDALTPYTWWFPIIGTIPYLAFFDRSSVDARADDLQRDNHDTFIYELDAYNASNFFSNPILSPVLQREKVDLASVVIHELLHSTVWAPDNTDFNESLATFVGRTGAIDFFNSDFVDEPELAERARELFEDVDRLEGFIQALIDELNVLYASTRPRTDKLAQRELIIEAAKVRFKDDIRPTLNDPKLFSWIPDMEPNNAFLLGFQRYSRDLNIFAAVHEATGRVWPRSIDVFRAAAAEPDPYAGLEEWLAERQAVAHILPTVPVARGRCVCHARRTLFEDTTP